MSVSPVERQQHGGVVFAYKHVVTFVMSYGTNILREEIIAER